MTNTITDLARHLARRQAMGHRLGVQAANQQILDDACDAASVLDRQVHATADRRTLQRLAPRLAARLADDAPVRPSR